MIHHLINDFILSPSGRRFRLTSQNSSSVHCIDWSRHKTLAKHNPRARHVPRLTPSRRPATRLQSSRARLQEREKATTTWQSDLCTRHWSTETRQSSHCLSAYGETGGDCHGNRARQGSYNSAAPDDDLVWAVVRGGQRRCYCDLSQKYMRACFELLILENVFLRCVARWAQTETRHGYT